MHTDRQFANHFHTPYIIDITYFLESYTISFGRVVVTFCL